MPVRWRSDVTPPTPRIIQDRVGVRYIPVRGKVSLCFFVIVSSYHPLAPSIWRGKQFSLALRERVGWGDGFRDLSSHSLSMTVSYSAMTKPSITASASVAVYADALDCFVGLRPSCNDDFLVTLRFYPKNRINNHLQYLESECLFFIFSWLVRFNIFYPYQYYGLRDRKRVCSHFFVVFYFSIQDFKKCWYFHIFIITRLKNRKLP